MINVTVLTLPLFRFYRHVCDSADNMLLGIKVDATLSCLCLGGCFNCHGIVGGDEGNERSVQIDGRRSFSTGTNVSFH